MLPNCSGSFDLVRVQMSSRGYRCEVLLRTTENTSKQQFTSLAPKNWRHTFLSWTFPDPSRCFCMEVHAQVSNHKRWESHVVGDVKNNRRHEVDETGANTASIVPVQREPLRSEVCSQKNRGLDLSLCLPQFMLKSVNLSGSISDSRSQNYALYR